MGDLMVTNQKKLVAVEKYLVSGVHIGTRQKMKDMEEFIYKIRPDGLAVMNLQTIDERLAVAANFLSKFEPAKILVVAARETAKQPVEKFAEVVGATSIIGRFMPGTLTNPSYEKYAEPDVVFINDPIADKQAVNEAIDIGIPIVSLCDTNHVKENIDLIIPANNKGKKSLALLYWVLAKEVLNNRGVLPPSGELEVSVETFGG